MSGKCGNTVFQGARYGQICYELVIPGNPRTPKQQCRRNNFKLVTKYWRKLSERQRELWELAARPHKTRRRLGQRYPIPRFNYFMRVNLLRANRNLSLLPIPPGPRPSTALPLGKLLGGECFAGEPVGPMLYLQTHQLLAGSVPASGQFLAHGPPRVA